MSAADLKSLLAIIEEQLDWGDPSAWQGRDFEILNELILEKTKVSLSASTLRRLWGRVEYNHLPSGTTLDTLARFAGFENWRTFTRRNKDTLVLTASKEVISEEVSEKPAKTSAKKTGWLFKTALIIAGAIVISLLGIYGKRTPAEPKGTIMFNTRPVTRTLPNSVIFTYDVKTNPGDSVFIQQSWDPNTRVIVNKNKHQFTSVYYRPGFYHAKLGVNNKVVKEQLLMIPTTGWLGMISQSPVPVYLEQNEFMSKEGMRIPSSLIYKKNVPLGPQPPGVEYYNVGNFEPVPLKEFSFSNEVRNDFHEGAAACQFIRIILFTDNTPVIVEVSAKGCVSDLSLLNGGYFISGKYNDLSGFGTDLSQWTRVGCKSVGNKIQYFINDKLIYESPRPLYNENIIGIGYNFQGTGEVKNVKLDKGNKTVFETF
jgi:hypothetical protein